MCFLKFAWQFWVKTSWVSGHRTNLQRRSRRTRHWVLRRPDSLEWSEHPFGGFRKETTRFVLCKYDSSDVDFSESRGGSWPTSLLPMVPPNIVPQTPKLWPSVFRCFAVELPASLQGADHGQDLVLIPCQAGFWTRWRVKQGDHDSRLAEWAFTEDFPQLVCWHEQLQEPVNQNCPRKSLVRLSWVCQSSWWNTARISTGSVELDQSNETSGTRPVEPDQQNKTSGAGPVEPEDQWS